VRWRTRPAFSAPNARSGRYELADNFMQAWLAALADPIALAGIPPVDLLVTLADQRL
jgi:hypothetical protein